LNYFSFFEILNQISIGLVSFWTVYCLVQCRAACMS
jgi:hypothetical protein